MSPRSYQSGDHILPVEPPLFAVCQPKGEAGHCSTQVVYDLLLLSQSFSFVEVASNALQVCQSHLKSNPIWVMGTRVLQQILCRENDIMLQLHVNAV